MSFARVEPVRHTLGSSGRYSCPFNHFEASSHVQSIYINVSDNVRVEKRRYCNMVGHIKCANYNEDRSVRDDTAWFVVKLCGQYFV
jgi:hypothetical protein